MWLARIEKVNKLSRKDSEKSAMPGKQEKMIATPGHSTSRRTTVPERWQVMPILASTLTRITALEPTSIVPRKLIGWSATGLDPGTAKQELQKFSDRNRAMTVLIMSGDLFRTILHLLQQMIVTLITHHIPLRRLEDHEQASTVIWKAFQTTSLNIVRSRPNHLQL